MFRVLRNTSFAACAFLSMAGVANAQTYTAYLTPAQEVPPVASTATGYGRVFLDEGAGTFTFTVVFNGLSSAQLASHIHTGALGANGPVTIDFGAVGGTSGTISGTRAITPAQIILLRTGQFYINVHSTTFAGGEIRGQLGVARVLDYDGDGQSDLSILRFPAAGDPRPMTYFNLNSTTGAQVVGPWGNALTDFPCPGDYDGDAKDDFCVYRAGTPGVQGGFWILRSSDSAVQMIGWGSEGDQTVARDYDGDGITDIAIYRRGTLPTDQAYWWILQSRTGTLRLVPFGVTGDTSARDFPAPEDYDGDGKVDVAVYRHALNPANNFIVLRSSDSVEAYVPFGNFNSDYIVPRDYDGDGKADYAVARTGASGSSPLVWWILQSSNLQTSVAQFGISSDIPAPGDFDGDRRVDITVARNASGLKQFWTIGSFTNTAIVRQWGITLDYAVGIFGVF